ncbi:MAG: uroporphyrinogen decarboxylase [Ottowia sp.]|nr:uroporphyrinogen decarboxylase [Ottowia sp.]
MSTIQNDTFLRAALCQATPYTPVWLMRQAGRYLPEYKSTRARAGSFMGLATSPAYATEVTLQPLARYPLDAAILFSDILTVPDAMGLGLSFTPGEGPRFAHPLRSEEDVLRLAPPDLNKLRYVFDAVSEIRRALVQDTVQRVPLIGFAGSPWTLACYMVEGGKSEDFRTVKTMLYTRPDLMHHILRTNADAVAAYLNAQIDAGAQAVMIFDTWGGTLANGIYQQFSLTYMHKILGQLQREKEGRRVPAIIFTKGGGNWLEAMMATDASRRPDAIGLDWTVDLATARQRTGGVCALQGNLDPVALFSPPNIIRAQVRDVLDTYTAGNPTKGADGHIFNLGHGISQFTPTEHVTALVDEVHNYSRKLRKTNDQQ